MPHILDAGDMNGNDFREPDADANRSAPERRFAWESIPRCLVVAGVLGMIIMLSWRPAMLRFSQLMFLVSPSHGDSLAWKPDSDGQGRPAPRRHTLAPAEWRLTATTYGGWKPARSQPVPNHAAVDEDLASRDWGRLSFNPWNWQDDVDFMRKRSEAGPVDPDQQPLTAFRAKDGDNWTSQPRRIDVSQSTTPQPDADLAAATTPSRPSSSSPSLAMPSLSPVPLEIPALPSVQIRETTAPAPSETPKPSPTENPASTPEESPVPEKAATEEAAPPLIESRPGLLELPPLSFDDIDIAAAGENAHEKEPENSEGKNIEDSAPSASDPIPGIPAESPVTPTLASTEPEARAASPSPIAQPENPNWADTEITAPIPGAYLTIYPKLKFVGLCVPGQGYIRKYNQIAVPQNTTSPKFGADDGRTPYGKYYIASRTRTQNGPALVLSWPSPEDAQRIGLPQAQLTEIENAWLTQTLPPQNTIAGGNIALTPDRNNQEQTKGGFSLEPPHLEEISTALPHGAWVFIQP